MDRFQDCGCGCGRWVELVEWDIDGAEYLQPEGFYDDSCERWFRNECGDRKSRRCEPCQAHEVSVEMRAIAQSIENASFNDDFEAALANLRKLVVAESGLGRRLRKLIAKKQRPVMSTESCDPAKCVECRQGAA